MYNIYIYICILYIYMYNIYIYVYNIIYIYTYYGHHVPNDIPTDTSMISLLAWFPAPTGKLPIIIKALPEGGTAWQWMRVLRIELSKHPWGGHLWSMPRCEDMMWYPREADITRHGKDQESFFTGLSQANFICTWIPAALTWNCP